MSQGFRFTLQSHPAAPAPAEFAVVVTGRATASHLELEYRFEGAAAAEVRAATRAGRPTRRDELWQYTCGEIFFAAVTRPEYLEFNFSPSGDWAAYSFTAERSGRRDHRWQGDAPLVRWDAVRHLLQVALPRAAIVIDAEQALQVACTAVVEHADSSRSFWALQHGQPKPDFHARAGFVARISLSTYEVS